MAVSHSDAEIVCGMCSRAAPLFERAYAFGSYDRRLRDLIHLLKYGQIKPVAEILGKLLAKSLEELTSETMRRQPILVIPVPLFRAKARERGFNQAELLSRAALKHLIRQSSTAVELHAGNLKRTRATTSQTGLTRHQRRMNVRGAFALRKPELVRGRDVLVVDDVLTTGTTLNECARILRSAGADKVWVATVARVFRRSGAGLPVSQFEPEMENDRGREEAGIAAAATQAWS